MVNRGYLKHKKYETSIFNVIYVKNVSYFVNLH